MLASVESGGRWKFLSLPQMPTTGPDDAWFTLATATLERAYERWAWTQHHAIKAAKRHRGARTAVAHATAAWANHWQLYQDFDRFRPPPA